MEAERYGVRNAGFRPLTYQNATAPLDDPVAVPYRPHVPGIGLETFTLSSLVERRGLDELTVPQRIEFELLIWCSTGSVSHEVDFEQVDVERGNIVHIRPGQVHRWILNPIYDARLFLMRPLDERTNWSSGAHVIEPHGELRRDLDAIVALADPANRSAPLSLSGVEAVRDLLIDVLGLIRPRENVTYHETIYRDFQRLLGESRSPGRTVQSYASLVGCSARTLTRACRSVAHSEPKALVDRAVALEAQRQLSEPGSSATEVAASLGFAELSHFSRFFRRVTGETPTAFVAGFAAATAANNT